MKFYVLFFFMAISTLVNSQPLMIAHAGGGINGQNYTNSLEALTMNYAKGFRYFEMDFSWTSDQQLVCLHDWGKRFKKVFGFKIRTPLSLESFEKRVIKNPAIHPCTLTTLAAWLDSHRDVKIITDVKHDNVKALTLILNSYPQMKTQLIPQFYQPEEYKTLKRMGFKSLIWILYQYKGSYKSVARYAQEMELFALSMRASQAKKKVMQKLQKQAVKLFVYTINKDDKRDKLTRKYNVSGIYTDFLSPTY